MNGSHIQTQFRRPARAALVSFVTLFALSTVALAVLDDIELSLFLFVAFAYSPALAIFATGFALAALNQGRVISALCIACWLILLACQGLIWYAIRIETALLGTFLVVAQCGSYTALFGLATVAVSGWLEHFRWRKSRQLSGRGDR